jgi:hypothetical protein
MHVAAYIERHPGSPQTIKQHLAAINTDENDSNEILMDHPVWSRPGRQIATRMFHNILTFRLLQN